MAFPVFIPMTYESRFSLLGSMARELAEAFARRGCLVNPAQDPGDAPSLVVYFNFLPDIADLHPSIRRPGSRAALVQFMVDHPLALHEHQMDATSRMPNFRLLMPCIDGTHTLRLRWPGLIHGHCLHGVAPGALIDAAAIEDSHARRSDARPMDVVVTGSIHTEAELAALRERIPAPIRSLADDTADLLVADPWMPFEQALELTLGAANIPTGQWALASLVWRFVTAAVNRRRRIDVVRSLAGLDVHVFGGDAWANQCTGTIIHHGAVDYAAMPGILARAKVALAWGPTQFVHSFSERLLLALAAGAATIADDRILVRRHFGVREAGAPAPACATVVRGNDAGAVRAPAEELLADPELRIACAALGREAVAQRHLWDHRVEAIAAIGSAAIAA
jgi:hypothetical protein